MNKYAHMKKASNTPECIYIHLSDINIYIIR